MLATKILFLCLHPPCRTRIFLTNFVEPKITHVHPLLLLVRRAWPWTKGTPDLGTRVFSCFHQLFAEGMGTMKTFSKQCIFSNDSYLEFELSCVMFALGQFILTCGMSKCPFGDFRREVSELSCKGWVGSRPEEGGQMWSVRLQQTEIF